MECISLCIRDNGCCFTNYNDVKKECIVGTPMRCYAKSRKAVGWQLLRREPDGLWIGGSDSISEGRWKWDKPTRTIAFDDWGTVLLLKQPQGWIIENCLSFWNCDPWECFVSIVNRGSLNDQQDSQVKWRKISVMSSSLFYYAYCNRFGMRLATISSAKENEFLNYITSRMTGTWLGGSDLVKEKDWNWDKPSRKITYFDWGHNKYYKEPDGLSSDSREADCLIYSPIWRWCDERCGIPYPFLCERDSTKECKVGMSMCHAKTMREIGWTFLRRGNAYKNKVFFYFGNAVPWLDAQGYCGNFGMRLATVSNSDENDFLKSLTTQSSGVWLGGSDLLKEGYWKWDKPTRSITYYDWGFYNGIPQPNGLFNQNCLTYGISDPLETEYTWDDQNCLDSYPYLCERIVRVDSENWPIE
ncbi:C-type mannose receptor 2-like [Mytilus trossulus]|uniref:C-type mannose receptor 2-like n=1 Tax=Mytilus trossulus TaxID=6551 RepID=UPI003005A29D